MKKWKKSRKWGLMQHVTYKKAWKQMWHDPMFNYYFFIKIVEGMYKPYFLLGTP
jgi:hypothetical protein